MTWTDQDTKKVVKSAIVTDKNIHIPGSCKVPKIAFVDILEEIDAKHPNYTVCKERCYAGMVLEWAYAITFTYTAAEQQMLICNGQECGMNTSPTES